VLGAAVAGQPVDPIDVQRSGGEAGAGVAGHPGGGVVVDQPMEPGGSLGEDRPGAGGPERAVDQLDAVPSQLGGQRGQLGQLRGHLAFQCDEPAVRPEPPIGGWARRPRSGTVEG